MSDAPYAGLEVRGRQRSWRRWQMEAFDQPDPEPLDETEAPTEAERAAELAARHEQACREGYEAGHKEGREDGLKEGRAAGHAEGTEAGRQEGYQAGLAEGRAEAARQAERLSALSGACADSLARLEAEMGQALLTLALDVARQVVRDTLSVAPERVLGAVREVLHFDVKDAAPLRLWVNAADHEIVAANLADDLRGAGWKLLVDDTILPGGCRAETALGTIDATLQTRWRRVAASLGKQHEWDAPYGDAPYEDAPHGDPTSEGGSLGGVPSDPASPGRSQDQNDGDPA